MTSRRPASAVGDSAYAQNPDSVFSVGPIPSPRHRSNHFPCLEDDRRKIPSQNLFPPPASSFTLLDLPFLRRRHRRHRRRRLPPCRAGFAEAALSDHARADGEGGKGTRDGDEGRGRDEAPRVEDGARGGDPAPGEPRRHHGAGRRVPAARRVQGGRRRPARRPDPARLAHAVPVGGAVPLLPAGGLPGGAPQQGSRDCARRVPLGRRHVSCGVLVYFLPGMVALGFGAFLICWIWVAVSRALNGIGLAIVAPAIQSLVADSTDDNNRGMAFGWLRLTGNLRAMSASFARDPHFADDHAKITGQTSSKSFRSEVKDLFQEAKSVIKIPSFQIIVAQGVTGLFPWSALSFATMWLELVGFSHNETAFLIALFVIASSLGGLFGGKMGDFLSRRLPNSGRIILAQISSASAVPLAAILLLALPNDSSTAFVHGLVLFIVGFCISWNAPATNNPIFAEIVPEKSRTSVYALDRSFEAILSSFAPPLVGILAQNVYGYKELPRGSTESQEIETDRENAASLARALYAAVGIPMSLCCVIYSFLYCTYPRDRERARMEALIESEMQQLNLDDMSPSGVGTGDLVDGSDIYGRERSVIDVHYEGEDSTDIEDGDEKTLLYRQLTFANLGK
ncbi:hypothetical protein EUGRSUZ_F00303 [Eucalyptus grandis]|uniref:Uncharacterized protein n=2 Tax=Eucalyptus grandis TaxID=71139 RepID=A0ACC3KC22_EUCGR|nr:hypothetical protein EUGRSUZ_F00303 [Eucalyptus grandis]